jgi:energy-coupling factor transport system ATP-binding protein
VFIELQDVVYRYPVTPPAIERSPALDGVSLAIAEGTATALLGSAGSGRSTLLAMLNGLLKPTSGRVLVDGADIATRGTNAALLRRQIGLLMQNADDQLFGATVAEDVAFGPRQLDLAPAEITGRVREALYNVGLSLAEFGDRSPFSLSGGQRRRVAIAGILAMRPRLLALDEPQAGLDPEGKGHLLEMLGSLRQRYGLTLLLATKDLAGALAVADRFVALDAGRVVLDGDRETLVEALPRLATLGLELPTVSQVLLGLRAAGWPVPSLVDDHAEAARLIVRARRAG